MIPALYYIIKALTQLFLLVVLLRFWLPWLRADFRNPVSQAVLRLTAPLIVPLRRFLPALGRLDTATVLVLFVLQYLVVIVLLALVGRMADPLFIAIVTVLELAILSLNLFLFAILIMVILSWIAPHTYNPASAFVAGIAEPVLRPFRRLVPPLGGFDISPIFAIILLKACEIMLQTWKPIPF
ncbi:MAG TPA: YggT family protein [Woeseiaceae bacterium]|nr:YggT family protein [Woeseiaceae bacterium]